MKRTSPSPSLETDALTAQIAQISQIAQRRAIFAHLILRHENDLRRAARSLCGGDEDRAGDFVQEALLRAYRACLNGRFRKDGNPRAWLRRILTNLFINDYRHRRRCEADVGLDSPLVCRRLADAATLASHDDSPDARLMATAFDEPVERALRALPESMRLCVLLVDVEGMEYAEAAQSLGVPIGTVRSRLSRSRQLLRPLLRAYAEERRYLSPLSSSDCISARQM